MMNTKKILDKIEDLWFSACLCGVFIVFPVGMWIFLTWIFIGTLINYNSFPWALVLLIISLFTVIYGAKRQWKNRDDDEDCDNED